MKLAIGSDEKTHLTDAIVNEAIERGHEVTLVGPLTGDKVPGIRAALCADAETAKGARLWNKANVLCISLGATSVTIAQEILDAWFDTAYRPNDEDDSCLAQVAAIEQQYAAQKVD